ncbi:MAG: substrate-binding domain-containing protein [Magnetococcus sp. XQGC-1]
MKKLGDLILPESLSWPDRYTHSWVTQTVVQTLAGTPVVFAAPRPNGWPLTLAAEEDVTWLDQVTVEELVAMAKQTGACFTLAWEEFSCTVLFRHQEPPVLNLKPLWPNHNQFIGTIRLMTC